MQVRIAILSIGSVNTEILRVIQNGLREAFPRTDCTIREGAMRVPGDAHNPMRHQYHSTRILAEMSNYTRELSADCVLGVIDVDLYVPSLNFVFGEADPRRGVAVLSVIRLRSGLHEGEDRDRVFERRAATEAIHELGHTYGLGHCRDPHCVMWFSNTLAETDRKGTAFCPAHAAALRAALRSRR